MIRQAHTYLVGALSGVTLIGIAIAVFIVLVSAQVFHELPIVNVSSPDHKAAAVPPARALSADRATVTAKTAGATAKAARRHTGSPGAVAAAPTPGNAANHHSTGTNPGAVA